MKKRLERIEIFKNCIIKDIFVIRLFYNINYNRKLEIMESIKTEKYRIHPRFIEIKGHKNINTMWFKKSYDRDFGKLEFNLKSKITYDYKQGNYT